MSQNSYLTFGMRKTTYSGYLPTNLTNTNYINHLRITDETAVTKWNIRIHTTYTSFGVYRHKFYTNVVFLIKNCLNTCKCKHDVDDVIPLVPSGFRIYCNSIRETISRL